MSTTTEKVPVREDGHSEGCNGYGVIGFEVKNRRIVKYTYCRISARNHWITTTNTIEGTSCL